MSLYDFLSIFNKFESKFLILIYHCKTNKFVLLFPFYIIIIIIIIIINFLFDKHNHTQKHFLRYDLCICNKQNK